RHWLDFGFRTLRRARPAALVVRLTVLARLVRVALGLGRVLEAHLDALVRLREVLLARIEAERLLVEVLRLRQLRAMLGAVDGQGIGQRLVGHADVVHAGGFLVALEGLAVHPVPERLPPEAALGQTVAVL